LDWASVSDVERLSDIARGGPWELDESAGGWRIVSRWSDDHGAQHEKLIAQGEWRDEKVARFIVAAANAAAGLAAEVRNTRVYRRRLDRLLEERVIPAARKAGVPDPNRRWPGAIGGGGRAHPDPIEEIEAIAKWLEYPHE
jgi:hypothetical protein